MAAATSSMVCTWFVAACMSVTCESDQPSPILSGRRCSSRRRRFLSGAGGGGVGRTQLASSLIPAWCGSSSIQGLISSLEPCNEYYSSRGLNSSDFLFGDSIFRSRNVPRRKRIQPAAPRSGVCV